MQHTHQKFNKIMDSNLSDVQSLLKNGQKPDSFADHIKQYFKSTTSHTDLCKCMAFKVLNNLNPIGLMK